MREGKLEKGMTDEELINDETMNWKTSQIYADRKMQRGGALLMATAGRHGLLMVGSPVRKTMLAGRVPRIMPAMDEDELIRTAVETVR